MSPGVPVLHAVTDDRVIAAPGFEDRAAALLRAHGGRTALHLRGPGTTVRLLHELARALVPAARSASARLLVSDRADVALAVGADGVQLGRRSIPVEAARRLAADWLIGASVHSVREAEEARGADFFVLGTIWPSASHPDRPGAGTALVEEVAGRVAVPVVAIGGVQPERVVEARRAGAAGVAAIRGIWERDDPAAAAAEYLEAWERGG